MKRIQRGKNLSISLERNFVASFGREKRDWMSFSYDKRNKKLLSKKLQREVDMSNVHFPESNQKQQSQLSEDQERFKEKDVGMLYT